MKGRWRPLVVALVLAASSVTFGRDFTEKECPVVGNSETHIYHIPGDRNYRQMLQENTKKDNRVCFKSGAEAEKAGYRRSRSGRGKGTSHRERSESLHPRDPHTGG
jgi:hypothetical protein